jgi:HD-GYP domain-containing protein (c-di-GMP phosphodiesterase class II)
MERLSRDWLVSALALVGASAVIPAAALHFVVGEGEAPFSYTVHFVLISVSAVLAGGAAAGLTAVGARRRDGRAVLVGTAFSVMMALLAVHGIATEEILAPEENGLSPLAGAAALPVGGAVLALSALPSLRRPENIRALLWLQGVLILGVAALGAVGMLFPESVPALPKPGDPIATLALLAGLVLFGALAQRAVRTYLLTRRLADLSVLVGTVWLGVALVPQLMMAVWGWGWWIGHILELGGIALVGVPVALDLHRGAQSRPLAGDLLGAELVAAEEAFLGPRVRSLMLRLAEKDAYTEGHTRRVGLRAVQVAEALELSPRRLRNLAMGGLLHDMGKLSVPDTILQKPGPLTAEEYAVIRSHPEWGEQLLAELGGFSSGVRRLVLDHHERLDGDGYPRGLSGDEIGLETRILTVCDVYDALISTRVYRAAWSEEAALALLREESGTAFDPHCVTALEAVRERERAQRAQPDSSGAPTGAVRTRSRRDAGPVVAGRRRRVRQSA